MLHTLRFSLQNAVYVIMVPFLVPVLFTFHIQVCQNFNVKLWCQNVKYIIYIILIDVSLMVFEPARERWESQDLISVATLPTESFMVYNGAS
jgi:hypothetical protein